MDLTTALTIKAQVVGENQINGLAGGLKKVEGQSQKTAGAMARLKTAAGGLTSALRTVLPILGTAALVKFGKDSLDAADNISKLSQRTGIAAPQLDKFRKVAELSDTSIDGLEKGFKTLATSMFDTQVKGTGPAAEAFQALGISVTDANGKLKATDQVMLEVADKFQQMEDGPKKAALAADLFGAKVGNDLIPLLNSGGDAVRNMSTSMTQEFADGAASFNDKLENMQEKFGDMALTLMEKALPALTTLADMLSGLLDAFNNLPGPVQTLIVAIGGIGAAAAVLAPVVSAFSGLVPIISGIVGALTGGGGLLGAIAAVFTGPVGWIALAVAAGVAIFTFRDEIGAAFGAIGEFFKSAADFYVKNWVEPVMSLGKSIVDFYVKTWTKIFDFIKQPFEAGIKFVQDNFIKPIQDTIKTVVDSIQQNWSALQQGLVSPFEAAANVIRTVLNSVIGGVEGAINGVVGAINRLIVGANNIGSKVGLPQIPQIPTVSLPRFAQGGVVNGPTVAMVGEGGESEYIIPASKMARASANYLSGMRGPGVIPRFAEGGYVAPSANVSIQTGPVTQMNGQNFVTMQDMQSAVKAGVNQTLSMIQNDIGVRNRLRLA